MPIVNILRIKNVPIGDLKADPANPRRITATPATPEVTT
jgi:hypothetical protein